MNNRVSYIVENIIICYTT